MILKNNWQERWRGRNRRLILQRERWRPLRALTSRPAVWTRWLLHYRIRTLRLAPALMALLLVGSGAYFERHQRVERGEAAKRQLMTAMRIAGEKLYTTEQRVMAAGE